MSKLSQQEEKELISFIKDWLKSHGFNQKDLAYELNIKSSRTYEIILKMKELYNSNDFSQLSINHQSLNRFYNVKDNFSTDKKLLLISKEICLITEENRLRKTFLKGIKNFSFWHYCQWTLEKELFFKFFLQLIMNFFYSAYN